MTKTRGLLRSCLPVVVGVFAWLGGCSASSKEGVTVAVEIASPTTPPITNGGRSFRTSAGVDVTLTRGYLNTGSVELFGCASASLRLELFRMAVAHAHVVGSPTLLGIPSVESLVLDDGGRTKVGDLHPPPGSYCRVKQSIVAADADAPGSPADGSMLGRSLLLEGTFEVAGAAARPFRLTSTASFDVAVDIDAVALSVEGRRSATVVLFMKEGAWFDGVDLAGDEEEAARRVLENLRALLGARVE